jgi:ribosome-binding factor A
MSRRYRGSKNEISQLCGEPGPEDGLDPRESRRSLSRKPGGRKAHQLCSQVGEALNYAFAAVCDDDVLRDLLVVAIQPAPDESRLLVSVGSALGTRCDPALVTDHLQRAQGKLRAEVATSIHRKKVPDLSFRVLTEMPTCSRLRPTANSTAEQG